MGEAIISVENLGKCYQVGKERQQGYTALRDVIANRAKRILRGGLNKFQSTHTEDFWALKDVNFEINRGDAVGIIGRNGAGKSTLLKLLSRITEPTTGRIILNGRVASLLEVGTGFHPELTGRENIYLNGSILGMSRREIKSKFDEIVDFSGVGKFLDTPVKRFSSGMYVRLAFAVAAHLEPEILVVDEVLAVGDAEFQKKCLGKMNDVAKGGRTVLFVSHNLAAIQTLCKKAVLLEKGSTPGITSTHEAVKKYLYGSEISNIGYEKFTPKKNNLEACILEAKLKNSKQENTNILETCEDMYVEIIWENLSGISINASIELHSYGGVELFNAFDTPSDWNGKQKSGKGLYSSTVKIGKNFLKAGEYFFRLGLYSPTPTRLVDIQHSVLSFSMVDPMDERCLARGPYAFQFDNNVLLPALEWHSHKINTEL